MARSHETVPSAVKMFQVCSDQLAAHPMALVVQYELITPARPFVPAAMVPTLAYRRRKWEEREEYCYGLCPPSWKSTHPHNLNEGVLTYISRNRVDGSPPTPSQFHPHLSTSPSGVRLHFFTPTELS